MPGVSPFGHSSCSTFGSSTMCLATLKWKKWCAHQNRIYDSMAYRAKKDKETESFHAVMAQSLEVSKAYHLFEQDNPATGKWIPKKLIEWTQFKKEHALALMKIDRKGVKPLEQNQWIQRCFKEIGWTSQQATVGKCLTNRNSIKKDSLGGGTMRLWISYGKP